MMLGHVLSVAALRSLDTLNVCTLERKEHKRRGGDDNTVTNSTDNSCLYRRVQSSTTPPLPHDAYYELILEQRDGCLVSDCNVIRLN